MQKKKELSMSRFCYATTIRNKKIKKKLKIRKYIIYIYGDVRVLEVSAEDFIDATISHLYTDEKTGADSWWPAEVVESPDMGNRRRFHTNDNFYNIRYQKNIIYNEGRLP